MLISKDDHELGKTDMKAYKIGKGFKLGKISVDQGKYMRFIIMIKKKYYITLLTYPPLVASWGEN